MPVHVAVLDDYQELARHYGPWEELGEDVELTVFHDPITNDGVLRELLAGFDVIVAMRERTAFTGARLSSLPDLKLLVTTGMANASIDMDAAGALGITVCGTGGLASPTVELTWGLILALARHIADEDRQVREGGWQHTIGPELSGRTLGILGLGRLGQRVAAIAQAFEMDAIAWSENLRREEAEAVGVEAVERDELFARSDVLTIHTRLSDRTRGLVGARELGLMKASALLVNTSRGPIIDETALLMALSRGSIAGVALDVFDKEPLPLDHPLRTAPHTLLTPHLGYVSIGNYQLFYREAVEDIAAFLRGEPVRVLNG